MEALEVYYPYYRCLEEGYDVTIAAPTKKVLNTVIHDFIDTWETYTEKPGYLIEAHTTFAEINPSDYDGLLVPGGRAPEYIRLNEYLPGIVSHFFETGKPIGLICHASMVLSALKDRDALKGREMTAYIACKPDVESIGATYISETLHVDGNLVSGHAWPDLPGFMREFVKQVNA